MTDTRALNTVEWLEHHLKQVKATEEGSWDRWEAICGLYDGLDDRHDAALKAAREAYYEEVAYEDAASGDEERIKSARAYFNGDNPYEAPERNPYASGVTA